MIKDDDHCKEASEWMRMRRSTRCTTNKPTTNCSREEKTNHLQFRDNQLMVSILSIVHCLQIVFKIVVVVDVNDVSW